MLLTTSLAKIWEELCKGPATGKFEEESAFFIWIAIYHENCATSQLTGQVT